MKNNKCPKCNKELSPFYMKQKCPHCGINLLYYKMDERLESDAKKAEKEVTAVRNFFGIVKESTISDIWHIIRLVVFFLPLATMCLPMYWANYKNLSLISLIMAVVNHGFNPGAWSVDYLLGAVSIVMVIVLSLVVIIGSLFSSAKNGTRRDVFLSTINSTVLCVLALVVCLNGATLGAGFYLTLLIYIAEFVLHFVVSKEKDKFKKIVIIELASCIALCIAATVISVNNKPDGKYEFEPVKGGDVNVVSFNVASAFGTSFEDTDSVDRADRFADYMTTVSPDIIGTQEMNSIWIEELSNNMTQYDSYAIKRGGDSEEKNSEMNAVFWKNDEYELLENNTFWLSDTPDVESKYTFLDENDEEQEAGCNRICTYVVLKNEKGILVFMNTHLDNSAEEARTFGASVILEKLEAIERQYEGCNVVLTGDFNEFIGDEAYNMLSKRFNCTTDTKNRRATYQEWGYSNTGTEPIDFIFTTGKPLDYRVLDDMSRGYVSDHYGIFSAIKY